MIQEWLEGIFAAGHPGGLEGIFGNGGLWAVPLAVVGGLLVACVLSLRIERARRLRAGAQLGSESFPALAPRASTARAPPRPGAAIRSPVFSAGRAPPAVRRAALA